MSDPWAFGWTQLLTAIGFIITISIAIGGFKSFNRWKREKLEDKKIDVAFETLALAYEAKYVLFRSGCLSLCSPAISSCSVRAMATD